MKEDEEARMKGHYGFGMLNEGKRGEGTLHK